MAKQHKYRDGNGIRICVAGARLFLACAAASLAAGTLAGILRDRKLSDLACLGGSLVLILTVSALNIALLGRNCRQMYVRNTENLTPEQAGELHLLQDACLSLKCVNRASLVAAALQSLAGTAAGFLTGQANSFLHNSVFLCLQTALASALLYGNIAIRSGEGEKNWIRSLLDRPRCRGEKIKTAAACVMAALWALTFTAGTCTGSSPLQYSAGVFATVSAAGICLPVSGKGNN